jgi:hypothetical protein
MEQHYQITDIEQLTGIKAHTIRTWEKRYHVVEPHRTATNIRYYDDEQARRLLSIATLTSLGHKISHLALLDAAGVNRMIREHSLGADEDQAGVSFVNELLSAMLALDETAFESTFSLAVGKFGMYRGMLEVFYPFLKKAGVLWLVKDAIPVQEHFASGIIRRKLVAAIDALPLISDGKKVLLFLPPGEWHEIGLLFSEYLLRSRGARVLNLGQNVPWENLPPVIWQWQPAVMLTFFTTRQDPARMNGNLSELLENHKEVKLLVSGAAANMEALLHHAGMKILKEPGDLLELP